MMRTNEQACLAVAGAAAAPGAAWRSYLELTKPRLSALSVATALVGYLVAGPYWETQRFLWLAFGTAAISGFITPSARTIAAIRIGALRSVITHPLPRTWPEPRMPPKQAARSPSPIPGSLLHDHPGVVHLAVPPLRRFLLGQPRPHVLGGHLVRADGDADVA